MTSRPPHNAVFPVRSVFKFPGFVPSWVGPAHGDRAFWLGSEDGYLRLVGIDGNDIEPPQLVSESRSAINGIALSRGWLAVSTTSEMTFIELPKGKPVSDKWTIIPHGAHGVDALPTGGFVASLGVSGILLAQPHVRPDQVTARSDSNLKRYFYRIIAIPGSDDLIVCACRGAGIGVMKLTWGKEQQILSMWEGLDVVDVCWIGNEVYPRAVALISMDGTIGFIRDVVKEKQLVTVKYLTVTGRPYRIMTAGGHLYLLTSWGTFVVADLVDRFLAGKMNDGKQTNFLTTQTEGVDGNILGERWFYLIDSPGLVQFDCDDIHATIRQKQMESLLPSEAAPEEITFEPAAYNGAAMIPRAFAAT